MYMRNELYIELMDKLIEYQQKSGLDDYFCINHLGSLDGSGIPCICISWHHINHKPLFASKSLPYNFKIGV